MSPIIDWATGGLVNTKLEKSISKSTFGVQIWMWTHGEWHLSIFVTENYNCNRSWLQISHSDRFLRHALLQNQVYFLEYFTNVFWIFAPKLAQKSKYKSKIQNSNFFVVVYYKKRFFEWFSTILFFYCTQKLKLHRIMTNVENWENWLNAIDCPCKKVA